MQHYREYSGRVEICSNQRWETLSYEEWTSSNAWVACNELGFTGELFQFEKLIFKVIEAPSF